MLYSCVVLKMSLKAYEDACIRAELFGQPLPDKEEFLAKHKHLDVVEFEEVDIKTAENTAMLNDNIKDSSGGLNELNTILTSTQTKLNRLRGVCGTVTNFFRLKLSAKDNLSYSSEPSYVGQTNYDKDYVPPSKNVNSSINNGLGPNDSELTPRVKKPQGSEDNINAALKDLETMQINDNTFMGTAVVKDVGKQLTSQMSKLDQMIQQADRAQTSLQHQNKQMRNFLK